MHLFLIVILFIAGYILISSFLHFLVFPVKYPDFNVYFRPGDVLNNYDVGVQQIIERIDGDKAFGKITFAAMAKGPVEHIHKHFNEVAWIDEGELSVLHDGEKTIYKKGDRMEMKRGVKHKLFNESSAPMILHADEVIGIPAGFMYATAQLNGLFEKDPRNKKIPRILFHISMLGKHWDLYPTGKGTPPSFIIQLLKFLLAPTARLLGYKGYYPEIIPERK
ncbi:MAG: cupin domain-containing protein [Chitinophagales bacterium]